MEKTWPINESSKLIGQVSNKEETISVNSS